ncbi:hypothetical protein SRHO_G00164950 [Serrasalmus rhombeus]
MQGSGELGAEWSRCAVASSLPLEEGLGQGYAEASSHRGVPIVGTGTAFKSPLPFPFCLLGLSVWEAAWASPYSGCKSTQELAVTLQPPKNSQPKQNPRPSGQWRKEDKEESVAAVWAGASCLLRSQAGSSLTFQPGERAPQSILLRPDSGAIGRTRASSCRPQPCKRQP